MVEENIYQLRAVHAYDDEIYRVIRICGKNSLDDLSDTILDSYKFDHDHMYLFNMDMEPFGGNSYEINHYNEEKSTKTSLNNIIEEEDQVFLYLYDFGDEWMFPIIVEKIEKGKCLKPKILEAKGVLKQYLDENEYEDFDDDDIQQQLTLKNF